MREKTRPAGIFSKVSRKPDTLNKMIHYARQRGAGASNSLEGIATSDIRLAAYRELENRFVCFLFCCFFIEFIIVKMIS